MRHFNRKSIARIGVLLLTLMLLLSSVASYAAKSPSFSKSGAGIKYGGKSYKLMSSLSESTMKKAFGKWSSKKNYGTCSSGVVYRYTFKSKGLVMDILLKKKSDKKGKIVAITVSNKKIATIGGMKIGHKTSTLKSRYGAKYKKSGSKRLYESGKYSLIVYTKSSKVTKYKLMYDI